MKQFLTILLTATLTVFGLFAVQIRAANAADCGRWAPGGGKMIGEWTPSSPGHTFNEWVVTTYFTFSQGEIDALRCTGNKYYEIDVSNYGGIPITGGITTWSSNLPSPYLDSPFDDGYPRVLTVGSTNTAGFVANREYYTRISLTEIFPTARDTRAQLALDFQRSRWYSKTNLKESASCLGHGGSDPAWCVFPSDSWTMQGEIGTPVFVDLNRPFRSTMSTTWGRYRTNTFASNTQMNPGDRLYSPNGLNYLVMQSDGNLVEYIPGPRAVWASNTHTPGSVFKAQSDGNFVVIAPGNHPVWATGTNQRNSVVQVQDDRNIVVYAPEHIAVWANNVAGQP